MTPFKNMLSLAGADTYVVEVRIAAADLEIFKRSCKGVARGFGRVCWYHAHMYIMTFLKNLALMFSIRDIQEKV